jgi:hypothetical protein
MMMGLIIKDLSNKLSSHIDEKGGFVTVDAKWVNNWLSEKSADFAVSIIDKEGKEIKDATVLIKKKV